MDRDLLPDLDMKNISQLLLYTSHSEDEAIITLDCVWISTYYEASR